MTDAYRPKGLASAVCYQDAKAALRWLEEAFGFEPLFVILDADGNLGHSEMSYGNSTVMIGNEWSNDHKSPKSVGGKNTQSLHIQLAEGHIWTVGVTVHRMTPEEWDRAGGTTTRARLD